MHQDMRTRIRLGLLVSSILVGVWAIILFMRALHAPNEDAASEAIGESIGMIVVVLVALGIWLWIRPRAQK